MKAIAELEEVSRWYGPVVALNGVDLAIPPGVTGLLGPNGAGKTTLLRILTGQMRPSQGRVRVLGLDPFANPALYRRLGLVPDVEALPEGLTGIAFLTLVGRLHGADRPSARRRAEATLAQVGLSEAASRRIGGYSKGMRQRLRLAQAIAHEPELLVLDEPLSGLDPLARHDVTELVRGWAAKGGSVLISSHILPEVEAMTRQVLLLLDGRVRAQGEIGEIRELIDVEPRRVAVKASDPKGLAAALLGQAEVVGVGFADDGQTVTVRTTRAGQTFRALPRLALERGIELHQLSCEDEDLESVFGYLVRRP